MISPHYTLPNRTGYKNGAERGKQENRVGSDGERGEAGGRGTAQGTYKIRGDVRDYE